MEPGVLVLRPRRSGTGAARACRRQGMIPGIIYGKGIEPVPVAVDQAAFRKFSSAGRSHIHHVLVEDKGLEADVIVKDIAYDPVTRKPIHIDLHRISMTEEVWVDVPIAILGEEELEKRGLVVQRQLREVTVECLPKDVPEFVTVDVSHLGDGDSVTVAQIVVPPGVRIATPPSEVVAVVVSSDLVESEETGEAQQPQQAKQ